MDIHDTAVLFFLHVLVTLSIWIIRGTGKLVSSTARRAFGEGEISLKNKRKRTDTRRPRREENAPETGGISKSKDSELVTISEYPLLPIPAQTQSPYTSVTLAPATQLFLRALTTTYEPHPHNAMLHLHIFLCFTLPRIYALYDETPSLRYTVKAIKKPVMLVARFIDEDALDACYDIPETLWDLYCFTTAKVQKAYSRLAEASEKVPEPSERVANGLLCLSVLALLTSL